MAGFALNHGMGADQWKAVLVVLNVFVGDLPAFDGVAVLAIGAKLAAVEVGVAVRAMRAYVMEYERRVAPGAADVFVHAAQGVTGVVVIELGDGADGLPTGVGVAVLAGNGEGAVRIGYFGTRRRGGLLGSGGGGRPLGILWRRRSRQNGQPDKTSCEGDNCNIRPPGWVHGGACFQSANGTTAM